MPEISVIVPVYKVEAYLCRCVDSLLKQTFADFELILVDDGSPDRCPEICDEYARSDPRVHVIHKENGGLSSARNAGLDVAVGNWISFVDSDDWVSNHYLEYLYRAAREGNAELSICTFQKVTNENVRADDVYQIVDVLDGVSSQHKLFDTEAENYIVSWGKLYRASLFSEVRFPFGKQHEDAFVTHLLLFKSNRIAKISTVAYYYYQRTDSIMGCGFTLKSLDAIEAFLARQVFYKEHGLQDLALLQSQAIEYSLVNYRGKYAIDDASIRRKIVLLYKKLIWQSLGIWPAKYFAIRVLDLYCHKIYLALYRLSHKENSHA